MLVVCWSCSDTVAPGGNDGPWIGNWVQVNFLAVDDNGVWDADDLSGIGFVATVTPTEWIITDDFGAGCALTESYTVDVQNRFTRQVTHANSSCGALPPGPLQESGRLEFSSDNRFMIEWFDVQPGDDIAAYKWVRQ
jgi:hypothetical protein